MGINHCGLDIAMAQELLHRSDIVASFEQVNGEGMPEGVASGPLRWVCRRHIVSDGFLKQRFLQCKGRSVTPSETDRATWVSHL